MKLSAKELLQRLLNHSQRFVSLVIAKPIVIFVKKSVEQVEFIFENLDVVFAFNLNRSDPSARLDNGSHSFCCDVRTRNSCVNWPGMIAQKRVHSSSEIPITRNNFL